MALVRVLDMSVFALVAVAVLLPRPNVKVQVGLDLAPSQRVELAELQAQLLQSPGALEPSFALSSLLLDGGRPEWALAVLAPALAQHPADYRLHMRRSLALAEHFEGNTAYAAAERALALCENGSSHPCAEPDRVRLGLLASTLARVKDIDIRDNPNTAKIRILEALRPGHFYR